MKTLFTLIALTMIFNCFSQQRGYDSSGNKISYKKEDVDIQFTPGNITIPVDTNEDSYEQLLGGVALAEMIEPIFKIGIGFLEGRIADYSGEYQVKKSNMNAGDHKIPDITFIRNVKIKNDEVALKIVLRAKPIDNTQSFVYYVASTELIYSKARFKSKHYALDYTIEIIPVFLVNGKEKSETPNSICVTGVKFGTTNYDAMEAKYRTTYIPITDNSLFIGVGIKIVETNPVKISLEKLLDTINIYKDPTLEIIKKLLSTK